MLTASAGVLITKTLISIGDRVSEGQPLVEIDATQAREAVAAAELTMSAATQRVANLRDSSTSLDQSIELLASSLGDANRRLVVAQRQAEQVPVRQWKDSPERASASHEQAVVYQRRIEELWQKGMVSKQELDDASIALRIARNDLDTARQSADASKRLATTQDEQARLQAQLTLLERRREQAAKAVDLQNAEYELARATAISHTPDNSLKALSFARRPPAPWSNCQSVPVTVCPMVRSSLEQQSSIVSSPSSTCLPGS